MLLGVLATGCENTTPIPTTQVSGKTPTSTQTEQSGASSTAITTPVASGTNQTPASNVPAPANSSTQITTPAATTSTVTPTTTAPGQPVQQFVQQNEGQTIHNLDNPLHTIRQYLAYVPEGYNAKPGTKWPVIVFLHGSAELGNDINTIFWTYFAWKTIDKKNPYILITPQLLPGNGEWSAADLDKMLDEILPKYNINPSKIVLTGYSLGAHGVWDWAEYNPARFAGIVPVAGWGDVSKAYLLKNMPVWAFHGDADNAVNVSGSVNMVNAIKNAGGVKANLTIYAGRGHDIHGITYDNADVIKWMLDHTKM